MSDWLAFLAARLDEDEHVAAKAYVPVAGMTHRHGISGPAWKEHNHVSGGVPHEHDSETGFQMPCHDPARVLREVAAKRAILAEYERQFAERKSHPDDLAVSGALLALHGAVKTLGAVYSDHPDYPLRSAPSPDPGDQEGVEQQGEQAQHGKDL